MNEKYIRQFIETVRTKIPGFILGFDLADTKRRNLYLGMDVVDQDIQDFDALLNQYFTVDGFVIRISGDKWLCFSSNHPQETVNRLTDNYSTTIDIKVTWGCEAVSRNHEAKAVINETTSKITRAYRCLMSYVQEENSLTGKLASLTENIYRCPVNKLVAVEEVEWPPVPVEARWRCMDDIDYEEICPFCTHSEFDWVEGTADASFGVCKNCQAECNFFYT